MEHSNFFTDQLVLADDLNSSVTSATSQSVYRTQAPLGDSGGIGAGVTSWTGSVAAGGIYGAPGDNADTSKNFYPLVNTSTQIILAPGKALTSHGEFILNPSSKTINLGGIDSNYSWPSGSLSTLNYIKLQYTETAGSYKSDSLGNTYPTRYTAGYYVLIDSTPPVNDDLLLGVFLSGAAGEIASVVQDRRQYVRTITAASAVYLDPTQKPVSTWSTVADHINATGSIHASVRNPHGTALSDLEFVDNAVVHRQEAHSTGIVDLTGLYSGSVVLAYSGSVISPTSASYITFVSPTASVGYVAGGLLYSGSLPNLTAATLYAISGDGTYNVYATGAGAVSGTKSDISKDHSKFWIMQVDVTDSGDDFANPFDRRGFYASNGNTIHADFTEAQSSPSVRALNLPRESTLFDSLARIRGQIGNIVDGSGSVNQSWSGSVVTDMRRALLYFDTHAHTGSGSATGPKLSANANAWFTSASTSVTSQALNQLTGGGYVSSATAASASVVLGDMYHQHATFNTGSVILSADSSRDFGTGYQNTSGCTMYVSVPLVLYSTGAGAAATAYIGKTNSLGAMMIVSEANIDSLSTGSLAIRSTVNMMVPPNWYYRIQKSTGSSSTVTRNNWVEMVLKHPTQLY